MSLTILRLIFLSVELALLGGLIGYCVYLTALLLSRRYEIPYVSTTGDVLHNLLNKLALEKGSRFLELGCGDGRVACAVAKQFDVQVRGVDANPFFIFFARLRAFLMGVSARTQFIHADIFDTDFSEADTIYLFGMPSFISNEKFQYKLLTQTKPDACVISHWYPIPYLSHKTVEIIKKGNHETYIYR